MRFPSLSRTGSRSRCGAAAVEFAVLFPILMMVLTGVWEVGRIVQVQQILSNACREGGRIAAQGITIKGNASPTMIKVDTGDPNVKQTIVNYLTQAGIDPSNLVVTFKYVSGNTNLVDPYQAATGQRYEVTATLPYQNFGWTGLTLLHPTDISSTVTWASLVDSPFTLNETIPNW